MQVVFNALSVSEFKLLMFSRFDSDPVYQLKNFHDTPK